VPPEGGTAFVARAKGDSAAPDGHNPEAASHDERGGTFPAMGVTVGSAHRHIEAGGSTVLSRVNPMVTQWLMIQWRADTAMLVPPARELEAEMENLKRLIY